MLRRRVSSGLPSSLLGATASGDVPHLLVAHHRPPILRRLLLGLLLAGGCAALIIVVLTVVTSFLPESSFGGY